MEKRRRTDVRVLIFGIPVGFVFVGFAERNNCVEVVRARPG